jgi:hypothetical protein
MHPYCAAARFSTTNATPGKSKSKPNVWRGDDPTTKLRHSRWQRARACNHSDRTELKSENGWRSGCCL